VRFPYLESQTDADFMCCKSSMLRDKVGWIVISCDMRRGHTRYVLRTTYSVLFQQKDVLTLVCNI
jgi:hypothetical protein